MQHTFPDASLWWRLRRHHIVVPTRRVPRRPAHPPTRASLKAFLLAQYTPIGCFSTRARPLGGAEHRRTHASSRRQCTCAWPRGLVAWQPPSPCASASSGAGWGHWRAVLGKLRAGRSLGHEARVPVEHTGACTTVVHGDERSQFGPSNPRRWLPLPAGSRWLAACSSQQGRCP